MNKTIGVLISRWPKHLFFHVFHLSVDGFVFVSGVEYLVEHVALRHSSQSKHWQIEAIQKKWNFRSKQMSKKLLSGTLIKKTENEHKKINNETRTRNNRTITVFSEQRLRVPINWSHCVDGRKEARPTHRSYVPPLSSPHYGAYTIYWIDA